MNYTVKLYITVLTILAVFNISDANGQLTAPGSATAIPTEYPVFQETDMIYIYCSSVEEDKTGTLAAETTLQGTKTFLWEKYNPGNGSFELLISESTDLQQYTVPDLTSGGYRVTITQGEVTLVYRAWLFINRIIVDASITGTDCESFTLDGSFTTDTMIYYDLADNTPVDINKIINAEWKEGEVTIASILNPRIFEPPLNDTEYSLRIFDQFGCEGTGYVTYSSIVTKAEFSVDNQQGEAPLTVTFNNESQNGDQYEWYFFRDLDEIKRESEESLQPVDSIMIVAYDENPVYTYENSGTYQVKLVSKNISDSVTCADTVYLEDYIIVDTSFIAVPNVFTPDGDGTNDIFAVQFWSMQSIKIEIFNRWGKRIHFWESEDVRGFEDTYTATVWDGTLGGRYASPGVYYYVVEGLGRDNKKRKAHGFFHLFRGKD